MLVTVALCSRLGVMHKSETNEEFFRRMARKRIADDSSSDATSDADGGGRGVVNFMNTADEDSLYRCAETDHPVDPPAGDVNACGPPDGDAKETVDAPVCDAQATADPPASGCDSTSWLAHPASPCIAAGVGGAGSLVAAFTGSHAEHVDEFLATDAEDAVRDAKAAEDDNFGVVSVVPSSCEPDGAAMESGMADQPGASQEPPMVELPTQKGIEPTERGLVVGMPNIGGSRDWDAQSSDSLEDFEPVATTTGNAEPGSTATASAMPRNCGWGALTSSSEEGADCDAEDDDDVEQVKLDDPPAPALSRELVVDTAPVVMLGTDKWLLPLLSKLEAAFGCVKPATRVHYTHHLYFRAGAYLRALMLLGCRVGSSGRATRRKRPGGFAKDSFRTT